MAGRLGGVPHVQPEAVAVAREAIVAPRDGGSARARPGHLYVRGLRVSTHLRRHKDGPGGPRPLTAAELRRCEFRGLDEEGADITAGERRDERLERAREAVRFDGYIRQAAAALEALDLVRENAEPPARSWMAELILAEVAA